MGDVYPSDPNRLLTNPGEASLICKVPLKLYARRIAPARKFTYMLSSDEISAAMAGARLIRVVPLLPGLGSPRVLLLTRTLDQLMSQNMAAADPAISSRWWKLRADMDHFVTGGYVNDKFLKPLTPARHGVWTLKSVRPKPGLRVFGRFAAPDVFVATHVCERRQLKGKLSLEFELAKLDCEREWDLVFGKRKPFFSTRYEDYITQNAARDVEIEP